MNGAGFAAVEYSYSRDVITRSTSDRVWGITYGRMRQFAMTRDDKFKGRQHRFVIASVYSGMCDPSDQWPRLFTGIISEVP